MPRQLSPLRRQFQFLLLLVFSCSLSTALLPATKVATSRSNGACCLNGIFDVVALSSRRGKISSLYRLSTKSRRVSLDDEVVTPMATSFSLEFLTRKCFVQTIAVITGMGIPQSILAYKSNKLDYDDDNGIETDARPTTKRISSVRVLSMTLRSLPVSGCWAATITVSQTLDGSDGNDSGNDYYTYLAVVDTGSPFLTAPAGAFRQTNKIDNTKISDKKKRQFSPTHSFAMSKYRNKNEIDVSYEQYGNTVGSVQWRMTPYLTLIGSGDVENFRNIYGFSKSNSATGHGEPVAFGGNAATKTEIEPVVIQDEADFVLGIPSDEVVAETGGIFLGLIMVDAARPTPLQQLGYDAFVIKFMNDDGDNDKNKSKRKQLGPATLILWDGKQSDDGHSAGTASLIDRSDPFSMKLFDLTPYGPNLHHYGVLCERFECWWNRDDDYNAVVFDCDIDTKSDVNSCESGAASVPGVSLSRPLVAVFDTGLSGCIFSDSLWEEIQVEYQRLEQHRSSRQQQQLRGILSDDNFLDTEGTNRNNTSTYDIKLNRSNSDGIPPISCKVWLPTIGSIQTNPDTQFSSEDSSWPPSVTKMSSDEKYWRFQSFRLPWWYSNNEKNIENKYPHIVVLGSTFWRNPNVLELAVDVTSGRAKITTVAERKS